MNKEQRLEKARQKLRKYQEKQELKDQEISKLDDTSNAAVHDSEYDTELEIHTNDQVYDEISSYSQQGYYDENGQYYANGYYDENGQFIDCSQDYAAWEKMQQENTELIELVQSLKDKMQQLSADNQALNTRLSSNNHAELESKIAALERDNQLKSSTIGMKDQQMQLLEKKLLESSPEQVGKNLKSRFMEELAQKDVEIKSLKAQLEDDAKTINDQKMTIATYMSKNEELETFVSKLNADLEDVQQFKNQLTNLTSINEKDKKEIEALKKQLAEKIEKEKALDLQNSQREAKILSLNKELHSNKERNNLLLSENQQLIKQLGELRNHIVVLNNEKAELAMRNSPRSFASSPESFELPAVLKKHDVDIQVQIPLIPEEATKIENDTKTEESKNDSNAINDYREQILELKHQLKSSGDQLIATKGENQRLTRLLEKEQKLVVLLSELEALPDFIEMYHQERKSLLGKEVPPIEKMAEKGVVGTVGNQVLSIECGLCHLNPVINL